MQTTYIPAAATNIEKMWRERYGYIPASEMPEIQKKWADFRAEILIEKNPRPAGTKENQGVDE